MNLDTEITIIGAGLTGLTLAFLLKKAGRKVTLIEQNKYVGGVIRTAEEDGFIYEKGPSTGTIANAELIRLFDFLEGKCELETANKASKKRWILKNDNWHALPSGIFKGIATPLFTFKDKFRLVGEPFRSRGENQNETVAELVKRRMGQSFLDYAIDPFISGIYAGNPHTLITRFALPKLYNLEQEYGSFIGGAMQKARAKKTILEKRVTKEVFSVKGGLRNLISALENEIGKENFILGCKNVKINKSDSGYSTCFNDSKGEAMSVNSQIAVSTVGAYNLPDLLPFIDAEKIKEITKLQYAKIALAVVGYKNWTGIKLNAFGGLIPTKEQKDVLGILFPSSIFENRAPQNGALFSVFMGGIKRDDVYVRSEEELMQTAKNAVDKMLKNKQPNPDLIKIFKYEHSIPQYEITSEQRFKAISEIENKHKGLILAGNIRNGIGMADRVKQGFIVANKIINNEN